LLRVFRAYSGPSWFRILTHRSITLEDPSNSAREVSQRGALSAANEVVRAVEDLLSSACIQHCPIHIVPALFAAMGMHAVDICSGDVVREQLGYVKIRLSMIALRELKSTWPVSGWIFLLFTKIVRRIRHQSSSLALPEESAGVSPQAQDSRPGGDGAVQGEEAPGARNSAPHSAAHISPAQGFKANPGGSVPMLWEASTLAMPLNFPADWSDALDDTLWQNQDLDFWMEQQGAGYRNWG
jgi:hypothetical protein